jgi:hypothetical protein
VSNAGRGGLPYVRFRTALDRGDLAFIRAHASELAHIRLADALRICLLIREGDPERYDRAAVRWLGRFALEAREATINDLRIAADALDALPDEPERAMESLAELCVRHQLGGLS